MRITKLNKKLWTNVSVEELDLEEGASPLAGPRGCGCTGCGGGCCCAVTCSGLMC
ncbi:MAG: hypothetical protein HXS48_10340 [Theionarchaea archaeon]|nr:hypothetical protein [Theionarchaea archaeon]